MKKKVSIIIVNWNTREYLRKCLESLDIYRKNPEYEIFVTDNASKDGSSKMVKTTFPDIKLIESDVNLLFAEGNNIAYKKAQGKYIMLLNPDTEVQRSAIDVLKDFLDKHEKAGAVAGKFLNPDKTLQRYYNSFPSISKILLYKTPLPNSLKTKIPIIREYLALDKDFDKIVEIDQPAGAGIMVRKSVIQDDPWLLDPKFPLLFNDVDLCKRIHNKGYKIFVLPEAEIIHHHNGGGLDVLDKQKAENKNYHTYYIGGYIEYLKKHHTKLQAYIFKYLILTLFIIELGKTLLLNKKAFQGKKQRLQKIWKTEI